MTVLLSDGSITWRTCAPSDLDDMVVAMGTRLKAALDALDEQLHVDGGADYLDDPAGTGRRVLVAEREGASIGIVTASIDADRHVTVEALTIPGRCPPDEAMTLAVHAVEWLRGLGVEQVEVTARVRGGDDQTWTVTAPIDPMPDTWPQLRRVPD